MRDELWRIYKDAVEPPSEHLREQLAYRHMIVLADAMERWALDARLTAEQSAKLVGWAEGMGMRALADGVGPDRATETHSRA